ncbi:IS110 family transposase [Zunongwangia sp. H14]|uniref:IS110 family transposase n=1 Tax=Zunongwangia sp. H14 TaxID=3240792 RepID=UPI0035621BC4
MMKIKEVIGIDASKLVLDCCIHMKELQLTFSNDPDGIDQMVEWVMNSTKLFKDDILFVFEHTGLYTNQLSAVLSRKECIFYIASGLEVKRSLGILRGKDDKTDAKRIALYGYRRREEIKPAKIMSVPLARLKRLASMRRKLISQRAGHKATLKEQKRVLENETILFEVQKRIIDLLTQEIRTIEKEMDNIILEDAELNKLFRLLLSIKGIGKVTARFLIIHTNGFTTFKTWRKFASYCGIAPFPYRSGTSVRGRTKVSRLANTEGKALLHLCAAGSIQYNPELKAYYENRVSQGKNKMSTLNIIRNKLLSRAFSIVGRGTPYVDIMKYAS